MRLHSLQHVPFEGLGAITRELAELGIVPVPIHLYRGDRLPAPAETDALIVMGGPMGVQDNALHPWLIDEKWLLRELLDRGTPLFGICLGA